MTVAVGLLIGYCLVALILHAATTALVWARCRQSDPTETLHSRAQAVTIIRPVCGLEDLEQLTLASSFELTWPETELLFCVATPADPAVPFLRRLLAAHEQCNASILMGDHCQTANPKLNNLIKGWQAASNEWIILADSNLLLPPDYVDELMVRFTGDVGLVCAPPIACDPHGFWAEVECGFLNTYQGRWQYAADAVGFGFAQGKSMLWRRADLDRLGGIAALGSELAEDAAATKLVRPWGRRVRLAGPSFKQPIGERSASRVINRQTRWAQLRRLTFPDYFFPEISERKFAASTRRRACMRDARRSERHRGCGAFELLAYVGSAVGTGGRLAIGLALADRLARPRPPDPACLAARLYRQWI